MALLEVCCGSPESVAAAVIGGARRVELCADLEQDGLTPPPEWIREAKTLHPGLTVHVLIRPRAGDFVYTPEEADEMTRQIREALEAGADGFVIGALTPDGDVDTALMNRLISEIPPERASITFHRAFDVCRRPIDALEQIIGLVATAS